MERKLATVLFADLAGSTALGEQDPERTRATLERFYDAMEAEVALAGGTLEKFAGDAVMAAFGAPAALEDHAERALHAALAMQSRMRELFGGDLLLRIGVNTGDVVVGAPREGSSFVTGDAVNVAARLEQAAQPGEILVGERTCAAARGAFEFDEPAVLAAKGKPDGVTGARLVRAISLMRPRGVGGLRHAFVGRETELELLQATFRRTVEAGEPHLVTLMGDSGVGKTTLVRELWQWLAEQRPAPLRRTGRCLAYGSGITYWPLGEVLREHFSLLESDSPAEVRRRFGERGILALSLGLESDDEEHPMAARERLHEAWIGLLEELAAERPVAMLLEDLHWAEEPLLELVERLAREVRGPVLLIGTARPELLERRPAWGGGRRNASLMWLEPLDEAQAGRLVDELLASELPVELREAVVAKAEGNPFFVEELIATLIDRGVLERGESGWEVRELPDGFAVPDSIHAVLAARIDLLPPREKEALEAAAVVGRIFWDEPVAELIGAEPDFALLEERDFVRRRSGSTLPGRREFAIKHALTREVAYETVPKAKRAHLHAALGDWLTRFGEDRDDLAPLLAHHYAEASRPEHADLAWGGREDELERVCDCAVGWLRRSARLAKARFDMPAAEELLHRGLSLETDPEVQAAIWFELGLCRAVLYDGAAFHESMRRALELAREPRRRAAVLAELAFQTTIRTGMWSERPEPAQILRWSEEALAIAEAGPRARATALIARSTVLTGEDADAAIAAAREASEATGDPGLRSWALAVQSASAYAQERYTEAFALSHERMAAESEIADGDHRVEMREHMIPLAVTLSRLDDARVYALQHEEMTRRLSPHHRMHSVALHVEVEEAGGDWPAVAGLDERVVAAVEENQATACIRNERSLVYCAAAHAFVGELDRAEELEALAARRRLAGHEFSLGPAYLRLATARGDRERMRALIATVTKAETALTHSLTFGLSRVPAMLDALVALGDGATLERFAPRFLGTGLVTEPFAQRALGVARRDAALLAEARAGFERRGMRHQAALTAELL